VALYPDDAVVYTRTGSLRRGDGEHRQLDLGPFNTPQPVAPQHIAATNAALFDGRSNPSSAVADMVEIEAEGRQIAEQVTFSGDSR
jgi:hypothetical protein